MEKFLHYGSVERVLYCGSIEDCADPLLDIKDHNRFLCRGNVEKFLHHGSVERVLYRGSMDDCVDPLLGIKHNKDFQMLLGIKNHNNSQNKRGEVPTPGKCGKGERSYTVEA